MTINFPKLEPWQQDVYNDVKEAFKSGKVFTVKSKRQIGKSTLMCIILITYAIEHACCRSIVIEPSNTNNRNLYRDIKRWLEPCGICSKFNDSLYEIEFNNGSVIVFKSAESRDRLRGDHCNGILCIDEAQFIQKDILQIILPYVDAANAPMLLISTPLFADSDNIFYNFFINADGKQSFSYDWSDSKYDTSKYLTPEKLEFYRKTLTDFKFRTEILGEFISDGGYVFKNINNCIGTSSKPPKYGGIDWGSGSNGDYTVLVLFDEDKKVTEIWYTNDMEPTQQINKIAEIINSHPTLKRIKVETNSIGNVYMSMLKKQCKSGLIQGFTTLNDSKRKIIENLAKAFVNEDITIPNIPELLKQLQYYAVQKLKTGYTYNGINGVHDDFCMALAIAYDNFNTNKYTLTFS